MNRNVPFKAGMPAVFAGLFAGPLVSVADPGEADGRSDFELSPLLIVADPYPAAEATGALGMPADARTVPLSVGIIGRQLIEDTTAARIDETLDFVPGMARQNDFGGLSDNYSIRGFSGDINRGPVFLRDGVRANRGFSGRQDTANVEQVEVLRGSSSALYGRADPGGTVNIVTKEPLFTDRRYVMVSGTTQEAFRGTLDLTGPIANDFAYRFNAAVEHAETFRDNVDEERYVVAPSLSWLIGPNTRLDYNAEFMRQERPLDRGVVAINDRLGEIPASRFLGEPDDGPVTIDNLFNRLRLNHRFNADWSGQLVLAHNWSTLQGFSSEAFGPSPERQWRAGVPEGQLARERRFRDVESDDLLGVAELRGRFLTGKVEHEMLLGVELSRFEQDFLMHRSNPFSGNPADLYLIDIHNPRYGREPPPFAPGRSIDRNEVEHTLALYLQDFAHLSSRWRLLLGGRVDRFRQTIRDRTDDSRSDQTQTAFSPRAGLSFDALEDVTLYAGAACSFDPNTGADRHGNAFDPETAVSVELGTKSRFFDGRVDVDAAVFRILKENVLTTDPKDTAASIAAGDVESRGVELDVNAWITEQWRIALSYAYTDAKILADGVDFKEDKRVINVPRHSSSLLTNYEFFPGGRRAGIGGGLVYAGSRPGSQNDPDFELPSYITVQLRGYYNPVPELELSVAVHNLFDETYYRSSFFQNWVAPGAPRTVTMKLDYRF